MQEIVQEKMKTVVKLADHFKLTMPDKPSNNGQERKWEGLLALLDAYSGYVTDYADLLHRAGTVLGTPQFVVSQGMENLLEGLNTLSRACEQRKDRTGADNFAKFLALAEDRLEAYCSRWNDTISRDEFVVLQTPVAYFEKLFGITRSIFAPQIPFVALPLTVYDRPDEWQALAHEFGHFVYWNALQDLGTMDDFHDRLDKAVEDCLGGRDQAITDTWLSWTEELFADIVGTLLEGPKYALSWQDYAIERFKDLPDLLKQVDPEHPSYHIRVLVTHAVLRQILAQGTQPVPAFADCIGRLEQRWIAVWNDPAGMAALSEPAISDLVADVDAVVGAILSVSLIDGEANTTLWDKLDTPTFDHSLAQAGVTRSWRRAQQVTPPDPSMIRNAHIREMWLYLKQKNQPPAGITIPVPDPAIAEWNILLELGLDETHMFGTHRYCRRHWFLGKMHKHLAVATLLPC